MLALNTIRRRALIVLVFVIMAIAGTGIANTVVMAAYERIREVGTVMALGMPKREIRALFLLEGAVMGLTAGLLGAILGGAAVLYFQESGITLGESAISASGSMPISAYIYTHFRWAPVFGSLFFGVGIAVAASLQPANYAANLVPADAVRAE